MPSSSWPDASTSPMPSTGRLDVSGSTVVVVGCCRNFSWQDVEEKEGRLLRLGVAT